MSTFIELLMENDNDAKDLQKQVDGPQLRLGTARVEAKTCLGTGKQ